MASQSRIERLLGKAILDADFRKLLLNEPDTAAKEIRTSLTAAQRAAIESLDATQLDWWAQGFEAIRSRNRGFLW